MVKIQLNFKFIIGTVISFLILSSTQAFAYQHVKVIDRQLVADFEEDGVYEPFLVKGVGYSAYPIGRHPSDWGWQSSNDPRMDNWLDDPKVLHRDFALLQAMGVNAIRLWKGNDTHVGSHFSVRLTAQTLKIADEYHIKVIPGFWMGIEKGRRYTESAIRIDIINRFTAYVRKFKNISHQDKILFWAIGNEENLSLKSTQDLRAYYSLVNQMAQAAHAVEGVDYHPVALVNGEVGNIGVESQGTLDVQMPDLDIWGANIYRGQSFGNLFSKYLDQGDNQGPKSKKPLWISEFGLDAWHSNSLQAPQNGHEDQVTQALWDGALWDEIVANRNVAIGGTAMEYADEWWKPNEWYCTDENASDEENAIAAAHCNSTQNHFGTGPVDNNGDGIPDWYPPSPDNFFNAEWWGLMSIARHPTNFFAPDVMTPRQVYYTLQEKFSKVLHLGFQHNVNDSSSYDNHGVVKGDQNYRYVLGPSNHGRALRFKKNWVEVPYDPSLNPTQAMTMMTWFKIPATQAGDGSQILIQKKKQYLLRVDKQGRANNQLSAYLYINGNAGPRVNFTYTPNTWTHVAVTWDGRQVKIYENGRLRMTRKKVGELDTSFRKLTIGAFKDGSSALKLGSRLDEVKIYDRALTAEEINQVK